MKIYRLIDLIFNNKRYRRLILLFGDLLVIPFSIVISFYLKYDLYNFSNYAWLFIFFSIPLYIFLGQYKSLSSYFGRDFLPLGNPSTLIFVPQGLVMGLYGMAAFFLALYFWRLISIDYGSGVNRFDKNKGVLSLSRRGLLRNIKIEIPIDEIKAVKLEVREGFNPLRRVSLRIKGRKDLPISRVGSPKPLIDLENEGAAIARFLEVNLEGI